MNLLLAKLLESIPPEYSDFDQNHQSINFKYNNKQIYIEWYSNGHPFLVIYYEDDRRHRPMLEGPAYLGFDFYGNLLSEQYWENGKKIKDLTKNKE